MNRRNALKASLTAIFAAYTIMCFAPIFGCSIIPIGDPGHGIVALTITALFLYSMLTKDTLSEKGGIITALAILASQGFLDLLAMLADAIDYVFFSASAPPLPQYYLLRPQVMLMPLALIALEKEVRSLKEETRSRR